MRLPFVSRLAMSLVTVVASALAASAQPSTSPQVQALPGGKPVSVATGSPVPSAPPIPDAGPFPTTPPAGPPSSSFDRRHEIFAVGDYMIAPKVYNEYSPGMRTGKTSYAMRGAVEFNVLNVPLMAGGDYRNYQYLHDAGLVTTIGRQSQVFVADRVVRDTDYDGRLGLKILEPRVYLAASYLSKTRETGYPIASGYGLGLEKLPDYEAPLSVYFNAFYYPNLTGAYTQVGTTNSLGLTYRVFRYRLGAAVAPKNSPIFIDLGLMGDRITGRNSSPSTETHFGPYAGVGFYSH